MRIAEEVGSVISDTILFYILDIVQWNEQLKDGNTLCVVFLMKYVHVWDLLVFGMVIAVLLF